MIVGTEQLQPGLMNRILHLIGKFESYNYAELSKVPAFPADVQAQQCLADGHKSTVGKSMWISTIPFVCNQSQLN